MKHVCCHDVEECSHLRDQRLAGKRPDPNKCNAAAWCDRLRDAIVMGEVDRPHDQLRPGPRADWLYLKGKRLKLCPFCKSPVR